MPAAFLGRGVVWALRALVDEVASGRKCCWLRRVGRPCGGYQECRHREVLVGLAGGPGWGSASPGGISDKEPVCQRRRCRRCGFDPQIRKIPWRRKWQPAPVLWPGKSHRQRGLVGSRREGRDCRRHNQVGTEWRSGFESQARLGGGKQRVLPKAGAQTSIGTMRPLMRTLMKPPEPHGARAFWSPIRTPPALGPDSL